MIRFRFGIWDFGWGEPKRVFRFALGALLFTQTISVYAQQLKTPRIGYLGTSCEGSDFREFRNGLRDVGYFEGKNILIECRSRYDDGGQDRTESFVKQLMQSHVDVFVSSVTPAIVAVKRATNTIPIVMVSTVDPVETGMIDSLAKPGGNITGVVTLTRDLAGKRLELLKEVIPRLARVAVLWSTTPEFGFRTGFRAYEGAAQALKVQLQSLEVRAPDPDFQGAFRDAIKGRADALITSRRSLMSRNRKTIVGLANQNRLPSMFEGTGDVEAGGLMAYSDNAADQYRRAAAYVEKILKGAKPAELPVEQPTKFELIINLKTAKQIGLTMPPNVLARADKVIR